MRRNSRLRSLALAAAMTLAMQTIGAPVAYAEEDVQELPISTEVDYTESDTEEVGVSEGETNASDTDVLEEEKEAESTEPEEEKEAEGTELEEQKKADDTELNESDDPEFFIKALDGEEPEEKGIKVVSAKIEAESGVLTGKAKAVDRGDASGGKKVGYIDDTSSVVTMTINAPHDGNYRIEIAADGDKGAFPNSSHRYWVNGDESSAEIVEYTKATNWDIWSLYSVYVDLKEGENTFSVSHSGLGNSFAELDYIIFHAFEEPDYEILFDDVAFDGFDKDKKTYNVDVEDESKLPEVSVKFKEGSDESFKAKVTQPSESRPESVVTVYCEDDPYYENKYTIRFLSSDTFESSLVNFGADPFVTYHDGYYYYVRMGRNDTGIWVTKSAELERIGKVEPVCVYMPSGDQPTRELWAPELHFLDGKWYIYYTAGQGANHRMMVLESVTDDAQGEYAYKGKISPETDRWAIDQTVLELDGQLYAIWSGWDGFVDGEQRLYIAKMENPWTITGDRVELSRPEFAWEVNEHPTINEGAEIAIAPDGTVNIVYSASGSWSDTYCLGCLTLKKGADPMKADSWIKATKPVFEKNDSTTFSTGHASFVKSPDGKEDYLVFHATRFAGDGWNGRGVRAQRVYWNEDGTPYMGVAAEYTDRIKVPSGTKKVKYYKHEAEDAKLYGIRSTETYNSSGNACVYGFTDENNKAEFIFDVEEAGDYMLYLGASANVNDAALRAVVNGQEYEKNIYNFNANSAARICVDNWFGYEQKISLNKGSNTIVVTGVSGRAMAALDYIEYCKSGDAVAPADPDETEEPAKPTEPEKPVDEGNKKPEETKAPTVERPAVEHKTGDAVVIDGASYTITSTEDGSQTVTYDKPETDDVTSASIPATITIDDKEYKVTELADGAFKNNTNLKKVTIGANVEKIGKKAFYKCKNLKKLTIDTKKLTKKNVGKNAFKGINSKAKVKVPKKKVKSYTKIFKAKGLNKKSQKVTK
ncbi:MAG: family 43 glycosylhydrolase [Butyrivibrio sp.]|nr:family 43 glycosylhydrolase [Butyrivibrio sp.]